MITNRSKLMLSIGMGLSLLVSNAQGLAQAANDRFMNVIKKGELTVGVKADYKPFGFRNKDGQLVGLEVDIAQKVADILGVKLKLVAVQSSNRMQFLQQGKIDLMLATMSDKTDRRKAVGGIDPAYYAAGTNVLAKKGTLKKWEDLRGKPVCGKQGAFYNKGVSQKYGAKIVAFVGNAEAKQALRDGKCVAFVFDDSSLVSDLASGNFDGYEMPFNSEDLTPWVAAVPKEEENGIWGNFMSGVMYRLISNGEIVSLEKKWGITPSKYVQDRAKKFELDHGHLK